MRKSVLRGALDDVVSGFHPEVRERGVYRAYHEYRHTLDLLAPFLATDVTGLSALDVGTGAGVIPLALARAGATVSVIDTWDEYSVERENQMGNTDEILGRFKRAGIEAQRVDLMAEPLPYPDESFDLVSMFAAIEHFHGSPKRVLEEMARVTRPGGIVVLSTPNIACLHNRIRLSLGRSIHFPLKTWYHDDPFTGHVREYNREEVRELMAMSGLTIERLDLSERPRWNTQLRDGRWLPQFRLSSARQVSKVFYFAAVGLIPSLRYAITVIARKSK